MCYSQNCLNTLSKFTSYDDAINKVEHSNFTTSESISFNSSIIDKANYYFCSNKSTFLILTMKKRKFIFSGVPLNIWNEFKKVDSKGKYYHQFIKGKYRLNI